MAVVSRVGAEHWVVGLVAMALPAALLVPPAASLGRSAVAVVILVAALALRCIVRRLPQRLAGVSRRRPWLAAVWMLVAALAIVQLARLSAFMTDSSRTWGSAVPDPLAINHQCLSAYVQAADLSRRGERNVYAARWYPAFARDAEPRAASSPVRGLGRWLYDPYEYPPPFLLLPRVALGLTSNFDHIRTGWFLLQAIIVMTAALLYACWIGGSQGLTAGLLLPALMASVPMLLTFQFGQFHAVSVLAAVAGMIAFERRRHAIGGALLAVAILSKIFPALLLVTLVRRRCWRSLGWTIAFAALLSLVAVAVLGPRPFTAFMTYQVPRMATGEAFSFATRTDVPALIVSRNFSVEAIPRKLAMLGVTHLPGNAADWLPSVYALLLLGLAWRAGGRSATGTGSVLGFLALLNLAALRCPVAPSAYVAAPMLWMLALMADAVRGRTATGIGLGVAWALLMGPPPLPTTADVLMGLLGQGLAIALGVGVLMQSPRTDPSEMPTSAGRTTSERPPGGAAMRAAVHTRGLTRYSARLVGPRGQPGFTRSPLQP